MDTYIYFSIFLVGKKMELLNGNNLEQQKL